VLTVVDPLPFQVASLDPLNERSLVSMIRARYEEAALTPIGAASQHDLIYTRAGPVIIAINPLCAVSDLYTVAMRRKHHGAALALMLRERDGSGPEADEGEELPPHIYEVAGKAYHCMREGRCQGVIINGESGAGKTETTKLLLQYLSEVAAVTAISAAAAAPSAAAPSPAAAPSAAAADDDDVSTVSTTPLPAPAAALSPASMASSTSGLASKLLASSPVLECFGNAKTLRNDNSSRFGKLIKLHFQPSNGALRHASVAHYLLEKSRVASQQPGAWAALDLTWRGLTDPFSAPGGHPRAPLCSLSKPTMPSTLLSVLSVLSVLTIPLSLHGCYRRASLPCLLHAVRRRARRAA
jgi:myosin protein heavy chain